MNFDEFNPIEKMTTQEQEYSHEQVTIPQQITPNQQDTQSKNPKGFVGKYIQFLNGNVETILATSVAVAIGYAFQNLVNATVTSVVEPLIIKILILTHLNDIYDFASFISPQKNVMNFTFFISNVVTFITCVITVYFINNIFKVKS